MKVVVPEMSDNEIAARLAALRGGSDVMSAGAAALAEPAAEGGVRATDLNADLAVAAPFSIEKKHYKFVRPLTEAADSLIDFFQNSDGRVMLGLAEIDLLTRGFGPGELVLITGYTHSGKTQVFLTMVCNNRDRKGILFSMDEPAELVLTKLVCMRTGSNAERLEERVRGGDPQACERVRRIAREDFANLLVIDQSMLRRDMSDTVKEAEDYWGAPVEFVGMDYLELFARAESCDVEEASQQLKGWALGCGGSESEFPTVVLHQGSRGNSAGGQALTMRSMKYGGEQEAIFVLGVRRQRDNEDLDDHERLRHADTVDISVLKNKRPPSKKGEHTFYMEPTSGMILPLSHRPEPPSALQRARGTLSPGQRNFDGGEEA